MRLKTADIPRVQQTQGGVMADPNAAAAPYRALAQVGQALSGIGQQQQQLQEEKQRLVDTAAIRKFGRESQMFMEMAIENKPEDHREWDAYFGNELGTFLMGYDGEGLSEKAKERLIEEKDYFAQRSQVVFRTMQTKAEVQLANYELEQAAEFEAAYGDREAVLEILADWSGDSVKRKELETKIMSRGEFNRANRTMEMIPDTDFRLQQEFQDSLKDEYPYLNAGEVEQIKTLMVYKRKRGQITQIRGINDTQEALYAGEMTPTEAIESLIGIGVDSQVVNAVIKSNAVEGEAYLPSDEALELQEEIDEMVVGAFVSFANRKQVVPLEEYTEVFNKISRLRDPRDRRVLQTAVLDIWGSDIADGALQLPGKRNVKLSKNQQIMLQSLHSFYVKENESRTMRPAVLGRFVRDQTERLYNWIDMMEQGGRVISSDEYDAKLNQFKKEVREHTLIRHLGTGGSIRVYE